jgi:hypothetical protein
LDILDAKETRGTTESWDTSDTNRTTDINNPKDGSDAATNTNTELDRFNLTRKRRGLGNILFYSIFVLITCLNPILSFH